jgi:YggT family protein
MTAVIEFIYILVGFALTAIVWVVIANAVVSWLIAFDIVNLRNPTARGLVDFLDRITRPLLAPLRRFIPTLGGVDITPMILIIVIIAAQRTLLPAFFGWLEVLAGGPAPG